MAAIVASQSFHLYNLWQHLIMTQMGCYEKFWLVFKRYRTLISNV